MAAGTAPSARATASSPIAATRRVGAWAASCGSHEADAMTPLTGILLACGGGTLLSLMIAALFAFRVQARWIPTLVSFAVGALLGAAFLDLLPHLFEETRNPARTASFILGGLLAFFVLEKLLLWRHHHHHGAEDEEQGEAAVGPVHDHD